jgi:hypothetical protein
MPSTRSVRTDLGGIGWSARLAAPRSSPAVETTGDVPSVSIQRTDVGGIVVAGTKIVPSCRGEGLYALDEKCAG